MDRYAGETWGVTGSAFLTAYMVAALTALAVAVVWWRWAVARPKGTVGDDLEPIELAYVCGGPPRALQAALVTLRLAEAVEPGRRRRLFPRRAPVGDEDGGGSAELCRAVYAAVSGGRIGRRLCRDPDVAVALGRLRTDLRRAGWLRTGRGVWRVRLTTTSPLWVVVVVGVARVVAGLVNHKPVWGVVIFAVAAATMATVLAGGTPAQTGAALRRSRAAGSQRTPTAAVWAAVTAAGAERPTRDQAGGLQAGSRPIRP